MISAYPSVKRSRHAAALRCIAAAATGRVSCSVTIPIGTLRRHALSNWAKTYPQIISIRHRSMGASVRFQIVGLQESTQLLAVIHERVDGLASVRDQYRKRVDVVTDRRVGDADQQQAQVSDADRYLATRLAPPCPVCAGRNPRRQTVRRPPQPPTGQSSTTGPTPRAVVAAQPG